MDRPPVDPVAVMATDAYRRLLRRRRTLTWSFSAALFGLLMVLTALTVFTSVLDGELVDGLNGAVVAAYVLFFAPVVFAHLYVARTAELDELAGRAVAQAGSEAGGSQ